MATTMLVCKQCNFENEPERVYCHNCGAKLDRSVLPPEATRREDPVVVQERVRKMVSPRRGMGLRGVKHFLISVVTAAALAALVCMALPSGALPNLSRDAVMDAPSITDDMEAQQQSPGSHRLAYSDDQINAFLESSVRGKGDTAGYLVAKFDRVFVHFDEGRCAITSVYSLFGLPLYATTVQAVKIENNALVTETLGGNFGRLRFSARAMKALDPLFAPLWKVLDRDRSLLSKMQSVDFHKGSIAMVTKPPGSH